MGIFQVTEEVGTLVIDLNKTRDMEKTNFAMQDNLNHVVNQQDMEAALSGVSTVLSIATLFGWAVPSISTVALLMANAINDLSTSEAEDHRSVIYGGVRTLRDLVTYLEEHPSYDAIEVEFAFLKYVMDDGKIQRYVYGNEFGSTDGTYIIKRIKKDGGWI